jgi:type IV secretion system protein VirB10
MAWGQAADSAKPADAGAPASSTSQSKAASQAKDLNVAPAEATDPSASVIPAGTKIPLSLAQAISTKNAREGDPVYAQTTFPFVVNDRILVPAGAYIQGKISRVQHAGRSKTRAELLLHFTSMIYPSGYTVMLPASVENTPGADDNTVKDKEGTIQADKDTGKRVEDAAKGAAVGGTVGSIGGLAAGGYNGARYGGLAGIAGGVAWALLKHGPDVKLPVGTSIEMEIQRPIPVDASRIQVARAAH